jgi:Fe-S oxidoreductase
MDWIKPLLFTVILIAAITVFVVMLRKKMAIWNWGLPEDRSDNAGRRLGVFLREVIFQARVIGGRPFVGLMHAFVFWGFCIFALGTLDHFSRAYFPDSGLFGPEGSTFREFYCALLVIFSWMVIVGILYLMFRRYVLRDQYLDHPSPESAINGALIFLLMVTYLIEFGGVVRGVAREVNWWLHSLMVLGFLAYLPFTKHQHLYLAPFNVFFRSFKMGRPRPLGVDIEGDLDEQMAQGKLGVESPRHMLWKDLLDSYACIVCGRCTEVCPANISGKVLDPKRIHTDLHHFLDEKETTAETPIVGKVAAYDPEPLWQCTTCGACEAVCPVGNEHLSKIIGVRRYEVQAKAEFPPEAQTMFEGLEVNGNPWNINPAERSKFFEEIGLEPFDAGKHEYLFWVGCYGAYDQRAQKITEATVKVMKSAGVTFGYIEEMCTGDSARRMGNELLFQMMAEANVANLNESGVKKIFSSCPHCINSLEEYSDFGGNYDVTHHSVLINDLIAEGKLKPGDNGNGRGYVFHDPCYLGRYKGHYDEPRNVIKAAGCSQVDPVRTRENGLCCGGGGGMSWTEETKGERVNVIRAKELLKSSCDIAVGCPFCLSMIEDGLKAAGADENRNAKDIAEVLAESLGGKNAQ